VRVTARGIWNILLRTPQITGDIEIPLTLPRSLYRWRTFLWCRHNQIFSGWWVTDFPYQKCFTGMLYTLKFYYKKWRCKKFLLPYKVIGILINLIVIWRLDIPCLGMIAIPISVSFFIFFVCLFFNVKSSQIPPNCYSIG